jgi:cytochrome c nitrite reductase small subunit
MSSRAVALLVVAVLFGIAAGLGGYTFVYARGASYLTDDPAACANCHVMREQYDGWVKSSHRSVAVCNDCHTPHAFLAKYYTKALNGYHHSLAFTSGDFHEPIQIKARNLEVTEWACRGCHADIVQAIDHPGETLEPISCIRCHESVGHLR